MYKILYFQMKNMHIIGPLDYWFTIACERILRVLYFQDLRGIKVKKKFLEMPGLKITVDISVN